MEHGKTLMDEYCRLRENYFGLALPDTTDVDFDTELVSNVILALKSGKAHDIDGLSSEHIFSVTQYFQ